MLQIDRRGKADAVQRRQVRGETYGPTFARQALLYLIFIVIGGRVLEGAHGGAGEIFAPAAYRRA